LAALHLQIFKYSHQVELGQNQLMQSQLCLNWYQVEEVVEQVARLHLELLFMEAVVVEQEDMLGLPLMLLS
jgi:hypothetical protein